jgi:hypothetical protein
VRIVGKILLFVAPALWISWSILAGESDATAWVAVLMLLGFAGLQIVVLTSVQTADKR